MLAIRRGFETACTRGTSLEAPRPFAMLNTATRHRRHRVEAPAKRTRATSGPATAADRRSPHIVLVFARSHDASGRFTLTLHQAGYWVTQTDSDEEAAQHLRTLRPDAIVVDAPDAHVLSRMVDLDPKRSACVVASIPVCPEELLRDVRLAVRSKRAQR